MSGLSAAGALRSALDADPTTAGSSIAIFPDHLSCGPLASGDPGVRVRWWQSWWPDLLRAEGYIDDPESWTARLPERLEKFWHTVDVAARLVVWRGVGNANELLVFHAITDHLGERVFDIVDVPHPVGTATPAEFRALLSTARAITPAERVASRCLWQRLEQDNAMFRVITSAGLRSVPPDHYDAALLDAAGREWTPIVRVVAPVMAAMNAGDAELFWRVASLVDSGALSADGNPWEVKTTKVKRA
ncbi:DUF3658 domain-containing protein [Nocardia terrae]|uniref:DUF3658 domain-containing protein n=1 Tax=Nocardia terrae TaxID=2675851 RepID=UPI0018DF2BFE|nr:DUF3658 domain-containing protein [Nocardia terrae]